MVPKFKKIKNAVIKKLIKLKKNVQKLAKNQQKKLSCKKLNTKKL